MAVSCDLQTDIRILRQASSEIIEADISGNAEYFKELGKQYGPLARKVFFELKRDHYILLNPWVIVNRARSCSNYDLGSFEFWNCGDMVVAMCTFLDFIEENENASSERP